MFGRSYFLEEHDLRLSTKILSMGAVATLLISGIAFALMSSTSVSAEDESPVVTVEEEGTDATYALNVNVVCMVDGTPITVEGVNVTVYTVNITEDDDTTTIVVQKVAQGQTDTEGYLTFDLPEGEYMVCATYQGLCGFGEVNLTEDQLSTIMLHGNGWCDGCDQSLRFRDGDRWCPDEGGRDGGRNGDNGSAGVRDRKCDGTCDRTRLVDDDLTSTESFTNMERSGGAR